MNKLINSAARPNLAGRAKLFAGVNAQRSLHTPLGTTSTKDDAFQVSCKQYRRLQLHERASLRQLTQAVEFGRGFIGSSRLEKSRICGHKWSE